MRVLIGTETYPPDVNGAARFTQRLALGLQRAGHQVAVLAPSKRLLSRVDARTDPVLYGISSLPIPGYPPYRMSVTRLARRLAESMVTEHRPDVIHIQNHFGIGRSLAAVARARGIPLVATNHFVPENFAVHVHVPTPIKRRAIDWTWSDVARVLNGAATVTTPTRTSAALLRSHGVRSPLRVISGGIDLSVFGVSTSEPPATLPGTELKTCLFVGRLEPEKHVDDLLRALRILRERLDARLVVVGNGSQLEPLRRLARQLDVDRYVVFTGFVSEAALLDFYRQCDMFCMPGTAELQCLAALEAMAASRPIVVANALALPELVRPGVNGYTFRPGDAADLAGRLLDCLVDPNTTIRMGLMSRQMIACHSLDRTIESFEACYEAVTFGTSGRRAS